MTHQPLANLEDDKVASPLNWFTQILKEKKLPEKAAYTYVIGADAWKKWNEFPVQTGKQQEWFYRLERKLESR